MAETEQEECDAKRNANNVAMDNLCQSPVTTNTQRKIANVPNKRIISSDILAETIKGFKGLTLQSTINDFAYYNAEEDDAESDPNSDPKVATQTSDRKKRKVTDTENTNVNSPHKLLINWLIPDIIPVVILPIKLPTVDGVAEIEGTLHAASVTISFDRIVQHACKVPSISATPSTVGV